MTSHSRYWRALLGLKRLRLPLVRNRYWSGGWGRGESAALALAYGYPEREAIIDDLAGRKCAAFHGIPVRGTLGLVLAAKRRGFIPKARPVMEILLREGLYLSSEVLNRALKRVGE
jgi:predicted nucleic acid-binding protein